MRVHFNGRSFVRCAKDIRSHLGADLDRLQNGETPLDFRPMGAVLPGVSELRDEDQDFWYRVMYMRLEGAIYVLHCFTKKSKETPLKDINTARARLSALKQRLLEQKKKKS